MLDINDFVKKQIVVYMPAAGDKLSYRNDNMVISDHDGKIKYQYSCYRIFLLMVIGDTTITTGILRRAEKFGFSICFLSYSFRLYGTYGERMKGNTMLKKKQYSYEGCELGRLLIRNKITNQKKALERIKRKTPYIKEGIEILSEYICELGQTDIAHDNLLAIEGNAARVYFPRIFNNCQWISRKPRIKADYVNSLLDIGYTILFNYIDAVLSVFGFDTYKGVLHTCFYMRKSLVCDIMEPFRTIIDWRVRKGIALKQFKEEDFKVIKGQWQLNYKKSAVYSAIFIRDILENRRQIFLYIRTYYRSFMKGKTVEQYPIYEFGTEELVVPTDEGEEDDFSEL